MSDVTPAIGTFFSLMVALGCAWSAGFSPYGTVFVIGLILRVYPDLQPPGGLAILTNSVVLGVSGLLYAVDFVVSKFPRWDVPWHRRNGWIRVAVAVVLAFLASGSFPVDVRILVAVLGGIAAFLIHIARTGIHMAIHQAGTESFAVPLTGFLEEFLLFSILLPLSAGRPGLTMMMLGVVAVALVMALVLTWEESRKVMWGMLLGEEDAPPQPSPPRENT